MHDAVPTSRAFVTKKWRAACVCALVLANYKRYDSKTEFLPERNDSEHIYEAVYCPNHPATSPSVNEEKQGKDSIFNQYET